MADRVLPATGRCLTRSWRHAGAARYLRETRHVTTMLGMVEAGIGIAAVARDVDARQEHSVLRAVPLTDPVVTRAVGLIRLSGRVQSYVAAELEKLIVEQYAFRLTGAAAVRFRAPVA